MAKYESPFADLFAVGKKDKIAHKMTESVKKYYRFELVADPERDADICERLKSVSNVSGYIRRLIRDDIERG